MLREEGNATFDPADVNGIGSESDHLEECWGGEQTQHTEG